MLSKSSNSNESSSTDSLTTSNKTFDIKAMRKSNMIGLRRDQLEQQIEDKRIRKENRTIQIKEQLDINRYQAKEKYKKSRRKEPQIDENYHNVVREFDQFTKDEHTGHDHSLVEDHNEKYFIQLHRAKLRKRCIIRNLEPLRVKWDLFIIILAIFNSICIPISISFSPASFQNLLMQSLDVFIDCCFWVDIIIAFRTTYKHPITGDEVSDVKKIAKNYIKGTFWVDLLSTIPFEFIGSILDPQYE